jgi:hypothetical protein
MITVATDMTLSDHLEPRQPSTKEAAALWTAWGALVLGAFLPFVATGLLALAVAFVLPGYLIETRLARMAQLEIAQRIAMWVIFSITTWIVISLPTILFSGTLHWSLTLTVAFSGLAIAIYFATHHKGDRD